MAGAATVVEAASPAPAVFRNSRRFMALPPGDFVWRRLGGDRVHSSNDIRAWGSRVAASYGAQTKRAWVQRTRHPAVAPIQSDNASTISPITSPSFLPERAST